MFEILEHAADVGFRAEAASQPELFENAAEALVALAMETEAIEREPYPLEAKGEDIDSLLVNWLSEVLYYLDLCAASHRHAGFAAAAAGTKNISWSRILGWLS